jgi:hypothetical protein
VEAGELTVSDLGALAGIRVNGRLVTTAKLSSGDELLLGDVSLTIEIAGPDPRIVCRLLGSPKEKEAEAVQRQLSGLDISSYLPSIGILSLIAGVVAAVVWLVVPVVSGSLVAWSSGPISNSHKVIENDCLQCHATPFERVQDRECLSCHSLTEHSAKLDPFLHKHPQLNLRCADCHMEHNGGHGLIQNDARQCIGCHASMGSFMPDAASSAVASLAQHPQFRAAIPSDDGSAALRIPVDDLVHAKDPSSLKLNHAVHLKPGLRGKAGPVHLECNSCHQLSSDRSTLNPVRFEDHCQSCHAMEFDERLPGVEVTHASSERIYSFLLAEYTKLLLGKGDTTEASAPSAQQRLLPGNGEKHGVVGAPAEVRPVVEAARLAEKQLHTRTACIVCHEVKQKPDSTQKLSESRYVVKAVNAAHKWFPSARFSHGSHEAVTCESCHEKARTSEQTADLLLPGVAGCRECHAQGHEQGRVVSGCQTCHVYHESRALPAAKKHDLGDLIRSVER